MKIDRLIGILSILLAKENVTAPYLAGQFEVSRRTINRDIEDLCKAGIPVATRQGKNGGISIMEGYCLNKILLTSKEMQTILMGLQSLDGAMGTDRYSRLMDKISPGSMGVLASNQHILMNLTSWHKGSLVPKIELIQYAIEKKHKIVFDYFAPSGEGRREVEPYLLVFEWSAWYVWGYCTFRKDFRLFKLNRMDQLTDTGITYLEREAKREQLTKELNNPGYTPHFNRLKITAAFAPRVKWRLIEEYGMGCYEEKDDGRLYMTFDWSEKDSLYSFLLSFKDDAEILEPEEMREEIKDIALKIKRIYE